MLFCYLEEIFREVIQRVKGFSDLAAETCKEFAAHVWSLSRCVSSLRVRMSLSHISPLGEEIFPRSSLSACFLFLF
jgi:hypothetical protein